MGNFLVVLHSYGVFDFLGEEKAREVLRKACECVTDGNEYEVLEDIVPKLSFRYYQDDDDDDDDGDGDDDGDDGDDDDID
jgi:hypothetical protein